jgi:hypothetical protein
MVGSPGGRDTRAYHPPPVPVKLGRITAACVLESILKVKENNAHTTSAGTAIMRRYATASFTLVHLAQ